MSVLRVSYEDGVAWLAVAGFDGHYEVSDRGSIRGLRRGSAVRKKPRLLKPRYNRSGYGHVVLCKNNQIFPTTVHRVVCSSFWTPRPGCDQVGHLDGNPRNNRANNLTWVTAKENAAHRSMHRRTAHGERCHLSKLTADQVDEIRSLRGIKTLQQVAEKFGVTSSNVSCIFRGITWKQH